MPDPRGKKPTTSKPNSRPPLGGVLYKSLASPQFPPPSIPSHLASPHGGPPSSSAAPCRRRALHYPGDGRPIQNHHHQSRLAHLARAAEPHVTATHQAARIDRKMEASVGIRARPGAWAGLEKPRGACSARVPAAGLTAEKLPARLALGTDPRRSTDPVLRAAKMKASCCKKSTGAEFNCLSPLVFMRLLLTSTGITRQGRKWISYAKMG